MSWLRKAETRPLLGLILYEWPFSGQWAIGVLVGIRLILAGSAMIALGSMGEEFVDEVEKATTGEA